MKRVFFIDLKIEHQFQMQFRRRLWKKTGGYRVIEHVAGKTHIGRRIGFEIQPAHATETIVPRKEPDIMRREAHGLVVTVSRLVTNPQFHASNLCKGRDTSPSSCRILLPQPQSSFTSCAVLHYCPGG